MKKLIIVLLMFFFFVPSVNAMELTNRDVMVSNGDLISKTIESMDGNYISAGMFSYESSTSRYPISPGIMKYDVNGNVLWRHIFEGYDLFSNILDIYEDTNGDIYVSGFVYDPSDAFIAKLDKDGNVLWAMKADEDTTFSLNGSLGDVEKKDDKIYYGGNLSSDGVFKIYNTAGEKLYYNKFTVEQFRNVTKILLVEDDYILFGTCSPDGTSTANTDACIARFNSNNEMIWHKSYGNSKTDEFLPNVFVIDNMFQVFVKNYTSGSKDYTYKSVIFDFDGNIQSEYNVNQFSNINVSYGGVFGKNNNFAVVNNIDGFSGDSTFILLDENLTFENENCFSRKNFVITSVIEKNNGQNTLVIAGYEVNSDATTVSEIFKSFVYEVNYNFEVVKNPTYNGSFDIEKNNDSIVINVKPNDGFEISKVSVKSNNGSNIPVSLKEGKYYADISSDVNVSVMFDKIDTNSDYSLMKNAWSNQSVYFNTEDAGLGIIFRDIEKIDEDEIVSSYVNIEDNGKAYFVLSLMDNEGKEYKKISSTEDFILDITYSDGYVYVYSILDVETSSERYAIVKYDLNLNVVKEVGLTKYYSDAIEYKYLSFFYNMNLFKVYDKNLYVPYNSGVLVYNANLELVNDYPVSDDLCSVYEHYCSYMNGKTEDRVILGFDSNDTYKVYSGSTNNDDVKKSFLALVDANGNIVLQKSLDKYEGIISVILYKDYIIGIGSYTESMTNTEIFVMNYKGEVLQTMNDAFSYFGLFPTDIGVVTYAFDYSKNIKGTCSIDGTCASISNHVYSFLSDVKVTGKYSDYIEVPTDIVVGENIDVIVKDKFGYTFEGLKITDSNGNVTIVNGKSFTVFDTNVQIEPLYTMVINPNTGSFISFIAMIIFGIISVFIYKYVKKYEPITKI